MAIELGAAYISILPDTSKLAPAIKRDLKGVEASVSKDSGSKMGSGLAAGLGGAFKKTIAGAGIGAALVAGMAVKGGISRLIGIETAEAKLKGLGHSAKTVDGIMANALASVQGTAFGLDAAATTAAGAVAAGIKPGKQLEGVLKTVADSATIAGTDMDEMGAIFNKVAAGDLIQGEELAQLGDRGIPILKFLSDEMGVTAGEVRKLASEGQINFKTFESAMRNGLGGAAQSSGDTTVGAFKNMQASLSRIGANFLSGTGFGDVKSVFQGLTEFMGPLESKAGSVGKRLGDVASSVRSGLMPVLKPVGAFLRDTVAPALSKVAGGGGEVGKTISAVGGFFKSFMPTLREFGTNFANVVGPGIKSIGGLINTQFLPAFRKVLPIIQPIAAFILKVLGSAVIGVVKGVINVIKGVINVITGIFKVLKAVVTGDWSGMWEGIKQIFSGAIQAILGAIQVWFNIGILAFFRQGFKKLLGFVRAPLALVRSLFSKAMAGISKAVGALGKAVLPALKAVGNFLKTVFLGAIRVTGRVVGTVFRAMGRVIRVLWTNVARPIFTLFRLYLTKVLFPVIRFLYNSVVKPIFRLIGTAIRAWWNNIVKPVFNSLKAFLTGVVFPIMRFLWNRVVKPVFSGIGKTIKAVWNNVIKPVFKSLGDFINNTVRPAFKRGVDAIGKIWDGLKAAARKPVEFLVNTVYNRGIRGMMNKIPGVNLPAASFATGGVLPGYTPGKDVHQFYSPTGGLLNLSGGEAIMRPEFTRAMGGPKGIAALNKNARKKNHGPLNKMSERSFFLGGVMPMVGATSVSQHSGYSFASWAGDLNGIGDDTGKPAVAWKPGTVAYVRSIAGSYGNHVGVNHGGQSTIYAHLSSFATSPGARVSAGQRLGGVGSTGNSSGPHLHFEVRGGSVSGSSNAAPAKSAAEIAGEKRKGSILDAVKELPGLARSTWSNITGMGSKFGAWGTEFKNAGISAIRGAITYGDNKIPNEIDGPGFDIPLPDNPIRDALKSIGIFDNGGVLEPGQWAYNASNKPEAVFNQRQFKQFANSAGSNRGGLPKTLIVDIGGEQFEGVIRDYARDEIAEEEAYNNNRRRAHA